MASLLNGTQHAIPTGLWGYQYNPVAGLKGIRDIDGRFIIINKSIFQATPSSWNVVYDVLFEVPTADVTIEATTSNVVLTLPKAISLSNLCRGPLDDGLIILLVETSVDTETVITGLPTALTSTPVFTA